MLKDKAHCPFPDLRGIAFLIVHYSILSRNGVSGKSGAVHSTCCLLLAEASDNLYLIETV